MAVSTMNSMDGYIVEGFRIVGNLVETERFCPAVSTSGQMAMNESSSPGLLSFLLQSSHLRLTTPSHQILAYNNITR